MANTLTKQELNWAAQCCEMEIIRIDGQLAKKSLSKSARAGLEAARARTIETCRKLRLEASEAPDVIFYKQVI